MEVKKDGNKLTITVELADKPELSSSGKSLVLFTTHGFVLAEGVRINLNIIKPKKRTRRM